jgi:two-component sensor histidine kinase
MTSQQIPASIQHRTCNILETLSNLLYLAEMEADDPQRVRTYLSLSKERLEAMTQLLIGEEDGGKQTRPSYGGDSLRW